MASHIVGLDVSKVRRFLEPRNLPVQMLQPSINFRVTHISYA